MPAEITTDIDRVAALLRNGEIAAFPTETVYGLGADAFNENAVAGIFEAKNRPHFDPLIVHIDDISWLGELVAEFPEQAEALAERFWPGPLTLVLRKTGQVPDLVTSGLDRVAIRMPKHPVALTLIERTGRPLAAPSANLFGRLSPTSAAHVFEQLGDRIPLILDDGPCRVGVESTVVGWDEHGASVLRPGGISVEEIEAIIGPVRVDHTRGEPSGSPGQLLKHYAPSKPILFVEDHDLSQLTERAEVATSALLTLKPLPAELTTGFVRVETLTDDGNVTLAASRFFGVLHELDRSDVEQIVALPFPNKGLGRALNDRLRRAAATHTADATAMSPAE